MKGPKQEVAKAPQKREVAREGALKRLWSKKQSPHMGRYTLLSMAIFIYEGRP